MEQNIEKKRIMIRVGFQPPIAGWGNKSIKPAFVEEGTTVAEFIAGKNDVGPKETPMDLRPIINTGDKNTSYGACQLSNARLEAKDFEKTVLQERNVLMFSQDIEGAKKLYDTAVEEHWL